MDVVGVVKDTRYNGLRNPSPVSAGRGSSLMNSSMSLSRAGRGSKALNPSAIFARTKLLRSASVGQDHADCMVDVVL